MSRTVGLQRRRLFRSFRLLDNVLDIILLLATHVVIAPPQRPFVLAAQPEMLARFTLWLAFVALLASQSTCEAAYDVPVSYLFMLNQCLYIPDLDRLCILAASFLAASDMDNFEAGAGATVAGLVDEGAMDDIPKLRFCAM